MQLDRSIIDSIGWTALALSTLAVVYLLWMMRQRFEGNVRGTLFVFLACSALLFMSAPQGLGLLIPDSAEYYGIARRLAFDGHTDLRVAVVGGAGVDLPSRYTPWFSWFILYPFIRFGGDTASLIGVIGAFSILGVIAATLFARSLLSDSSRSVAPWIGGALFLIPAYQHFSSQLMTDLPVAALLLLVGAVYVGRRSESTTPIEGIALGIVVALAAAMRPLSALVLLPLLYTYRSWLSRFFIAAPTAIITVATFGYHLKVFGSPFRSGYAYWVAVPYDYMWMVFSTSYFTKNVTVLFQSAAFLPALLVVLAPRHLFKGGSSREVENRSFLFVTLGLLPVVFLHLFYFYPATRFFLPFESVLLIVAIARVAPLVSSRVIGGIVTGTLAALIFLAPLSVQARVSQKVRAAIETANVCVPNDAIVISSLHPVLAYEWLGRESNREFAPTSRSVELASKVVSSSYIPYSTSAPLVDPFDHRAEWLIKGGAQEAIEFVAIEDREQLNQMLLSGRRAVLFDFNLKKEDERLLRELFNVEPICTGILEITSRGVGG